MGSIGAAEIMVILVVALLVLGPERLPEAARQVGRFVAEVRRIGAGFQAEMRDAMTITSSAAPPPGPSPDVADQVPPPRSTPDGADARTPAVTELRPPGRPDGEQ